MAYKTPADVKRDAKSKGAKSKAAGIKLVTDKPTNEAMKAAIKIQKEARVPKEPTADETVASIPVPDAPVPEQVNSLVRTPAQASDDALAEANRVLVDGKELPARRTGKLVLKDVPLDAVPAAPAKVEPVVEAFKVPSIPVLESPMFPMYKHFYRALAQVEVHRAEFHAPEVPERVIGYCLEILDCTAVDEADKLLTSVDQRMFAAMAAAHSKGLIPGPVTAESQAHEAKKLESLANFLGKQEGNEEKAASMRVRAAEIREANINAIKYGLKQELDMSKLTPSQQKIVTTIRDLGGAITTDVLSTAITATPEDVEALIKDGVLAKPREGVLRLVESKLARAEQPTPKGLKKAKAPKVAKEPKEKKPPKVKTIINPGEKCLCGCDAQVPGSSRFRPGHDAKLHGMVVKAYRATQLEKPSKEQVSQTKDLLKAIPTLPLTVEYLKQAPWMNPEIAKAVKL